MKTYLELGDIELMEQCARLTFADIRNQVSAAAM
jgi:hypothetical protein